MGDNVASYPDTRASYVLGKELARGSDGIVYLVTIRQGQSSMPLAIKLENKRR